MTVSYLGGGEYKLFLDNKSIILTEMEIEQIQNHSFHNGQLTFLELIEHNDELSDENLSLHNELNNFKKLMDNMEGELRTLIEKFRGVTDDN